MTTLNTYGKYRAIVTNITDEKQMGRIKVKCPRIYGESESPWCLPNLPFGVLRLPVVGDPVWIEFEEGNTDLPIYTGGWLLEGALKDLKPEDMYLKTSGDVTIQSVKVYFND